MQVMETVIIVTVYIFVIFKFLPVISCFKPMYILVHIRLHTLLYTDHVLNLTGSLAYFPVRISSVNV